MQLRFLLLLSLIFAVLFVIPAVAANDANTVGLSDAEILAYPEPNVRPLAVDEDVLHDRWYVEHEGGVQLFDVPGGNAVGYIDPGFNFSTALQSVNGWTELNDGQWTPATQISDANYLVSTFSGVLLPAEGLPYTLAWALVNLKPSLTPGGDPYDGYPMVWRYTRLNIYDTVTADGYDWYQVGINQWVHQHHVARALPAPRPESVTTQRWISIDLYEQVVMAYDGNSPVFATLVSTGLPGWDTQEGVFNIYYRVQRKDMSGGVVGDDYYRLEEVPWTMFFDDGRALHGTYWHNGFGYRHSHGCANLSITDAAWLYDWVAEAMGGSRASADIEAGPQVYVYSSGIYT